MIRKIAPDKWKHFILGIPLGAGLIWLMTFILPSNPIICLVSAFIILLLICYGFELFSKITGLGHYELWDVVAGVVGGIIGITASWFIITMI